MVLPFSEHLVEEPWKLYSTGEGRDGHGGHYQPIVTMALPQNVATSADGSLTSGKLCGLVYQPSKAGSASFFECLAAEVSESERVAAQVIVSEGVGRQWSKLSSILVDCNGLPHASLNDCLRALASCDNPAACLRLIVVAAVFLDWDKYRHFTDGQSIHSYASTMSSSYAFAGLCEAAATASVFNWNVKIFTVRRYNPIFVLKQKYEASI